MNYFSLGMTLVRQWFPVVALLGPAGVRRPHEPLAVEFDGTVGIALAGSDRIEASIAGRLRAQEPNGALRCAAGDGHHGLGLDSGLLRAQTRVEARCCSSGALAEADPFVWLQLLDERGAPFTHETFLGRGVGIEYRVHTRFEVPTLVEPPRPVEPDDGVRAPHRSASRALLASGLHARVVARTYCNPSGPRHHLEVLRLILLAAGAKLPVPAFPTVPALALVPGRPTHARVQT